MRFLALAVLAPAAVFAADADAAALAAKARAVFLANQPRQKHWSWTTTSSRTVLDKNGSAIMTIPSVTVESPIRKDGRRCNAVLAWGDGRAPYLAAASADERCTVEEEILQVFSPDALLESKNVKLGRAASGDPVLLFSRDRPVESSPDPVRRCIASLEATVRLDPASSFPAHIEFKAVGPGCEQDTTGIEHYDNPRVLKARTAMRKGATIKRDYALQRSKTGNAANDYWICVSSREVNPLAQGRNNNLLIWGRRFELPRAAASFLVDSTTTASELTAESTLTFEGEKKDK